LSLLGEGLASGYVAGILAEQNAEKAFLLLYLLFEGGNLRAGRKNQLFGLAHIQ
jgi:hypothetical protein